MKPVVQACEEALVTAGGSGDGEDMRLSTQGGVFHVRCDARGGATAMGQRPLLPSSSTPRLCLRTGGAIGTVAVVVPEKPFTCEIRTKVATVDRVIDSAAGTFGVLLHLPNVKNGLPGGIRCRLQLPSLQ